MGSSLATTLRVAAGTGKCRVKSHATVARVLTDPGGNVARGVEFIEERTGAVMEVRARAVVLCASTLETTRILLASATPRYPTGLGDAAGVLGRYLMDHPAFWLWGDTIGFGPETAAWGGPSGIYIPRFENLDRKRTDFVRGYGIHGGGQRGRSPRDPGVFFFMVVMEMLARRENRVSLHPTLKDVHGLPALEIDCEFSSNELSMARAAETTLREMVVEAGFDVQSTSLVLEPGLFIHEVGTARMGTDPNASFLDAWNRSWEIRNLLVTDGACWVSCGYQNPTLTMVAITARACANLIDLFRRGDL